MPGLGEYDSPDLNLFTGNPVFFDWFLRTKNVQVLWSWSSQHCPSTEGKTGRKVGLGGPRRRRTWGRKAEAGWEEGERKEGKAPAICRHVVNFRYLLV